MPPAKKKSGQKTTRRPVAAAQASRTLVRQSEYARHAGVSAERVRQWRVAGLLVTEGEGYDLRVDVEASDARIARYRDPQQDGVGGDDEGGSVDYQEARARREQATAAIQELKLAEMKGRLIDRAAATSAAYEFARRHQSSLLNLPARVAATFAARFSADEHEIREALDEIVREHLTEQKSITLRMRGDAAVDVEDDDDE